MRTPAIVFILFLIFATAARGMQACGEQQKTPYHPIIISPLAEYRITFEHRGIATGLLFDFGSPHACGGSGPYIDAEYDISHKHMLWGLGYATYRHLGVRYAALAQYGPTARNIHSVGIFGSFGGMGFGIGLIRSRGPYFLISIGGGSFGIPKSGET